MNINFKEKKEFNPVSSWEATLANKLMEDEKSKTEIGLLNNDDLIKDFLLLKFKRHPKIKEISLEGIIDELKKSGVIKPVVILREEKIFKKPEHIGIKLPENTGLKIIEDEELTKRVERNLLLEEVKNAGIFKNDSELEDIYIKTDSLEKNVSLKTKEYYLEFVGVGLIKGGEKEVNEDFKSLQDVKKIFKEKEPEDQLEKEKSIKSKKIATITERGFMYGVSKLNLYGEKVSVESTSEFDDVKRGVDAVLEIKKDDDESSFMGLGIDVTFRGLYSEQFKNKFFNLLKFIRNGQKTKVKYFKNHKGEMMKEFSVPKIIIYFNIGDVKNLVNMIKNINDSKAKEEFKNSSFKFTVMNQIINQCNKLSAFAEESKNDVFKKYIEIINSIKELAWENPEIEKMLNVQHNDETSRHMDRLLEEFRQIEKIKKQ